MDRNSTPTIGFTCAYTPLPLINAAGCSPYRVLPVGEAPDQAGQLLHDNLCPHVKRVLDRARAGDLPDLAGMVFVNSCDAMRRLSDAWQRVRPDDAVCFLDLPSTSDDNAVRFFAGEISRLATSLRDRFGSQDGPMAIRRSVLRYNRLVEKVERVASRMKKGELAGGRARLQEIYNQAATRSVEEMLPVLDHILEKPKASGREDDGTPVYLFGNVLPDPQAFSLFESCGTKIVDDDFCTGSRQFSTLELSDDEDIWTGLAANILKRPPCARTFIPQNPGKIAEEILERAEQCEAKGIIGHTMKFCDPYLARMPIIREAMKRAGFPLLLLEGDCTLRSIEQQRTRIEAFVEMLR